MSATRPPLPPFTAETAAQKVQLAQDAWNTRDPERVSLASRASSGKSGVAVMIRARRRLGPVFGSTAWPTSLAAAVTVIGSPASRGRQ
ncbi:DUF1348 family protein [Kribbella sp. NPDC050124]|uniref:DUF1348 family protein n=1 Tax=Kribbella sp. NPDC050124 TaxID=3364114 RepID=UPI0037A38A99